MNRILLKAIFGLLVLFGNPLQAESLHDSCTIILQERIAQLLADEQFQRSQVGLAVYDLTTQNFVYQHNAQQWMRPASTQKLFTAIAALDTLGDQHSLTTSLYLDGVVRNDTLRGNLFVRAAFDPLFSANDMTTFVRALHNECVRHITGAIVFDLTMKDNKSLGKGWCWDDEITALTPLLYEGKDEFYPQLKKALKSEGTTFNDSLLFLPTPEKLLPIAQCQHRLSDILQSMMKRSNNLYAESIFYQLAALSHKPYATQQEALVLYHTLAQKIGYTTEDYAVADGSGLSPYNYLTPLFLSVPSMPIMGNVDNKIL